ncbi:MAG TPA: hypothetical protein ENI85_05115 [Deltaproteobacteria bacterium]|nr:hypothetical protein [Deltaproteobacteria bacterium]
MMQSTTNGPARENTVRVPLLPGRVALGSLACAILASLLGPSPAAAMPVPGDAMPSDSTVTANTGAANYRIPIEVPPGPGGLAPVLSLDYSSRNGDGPFGIGWNLTLSEIACSARFGVPDPANCSRFELDGQLLTRDGTTNRYHPFIETFQRIEFMPASGSWQVIDPNGTIFRYGVDPDARIESRGGIARWFLSEIEDPFGNRVFITYDDTTDPGTRYPLRMTWGAGASKASGKRQVDFIFGEARPDPIHDFPGGVERRITRRLTEIQVSSFGALVRRYAFGYALPGIDYTTGRSRLSWVQVFGSDCTGEISSCTGLPRREFEYTDSKDDGLTGRFSKFEKTPEYVVPYAGSWQSGRPPVRIGDVNGDGLPDLIKGGATFPLGDASAPEAVRVELNMGPHYQDCGQEFIDNGFCSTFQEDPAWSAALRNLMVVRPRADFSQILPDLSSGAGPTVFHDGGFPGIWEASYSTVEKPVSDILPASLLRPDSRQSAGAIVSQTPGVSQTGWIEGQGRLFLADLDADGLADLVVSVRLSGVDKVLAADGTPIPPSAVQREPGIEVRMVYRNTGDPAVGWVADPDLAAGLPAFGIVQFESGYGTESKLPFAPSEAPALISQAIQFTGGAIGPGPCGVRGLAGGPTPVAGQLHLSPDVCLNYVNLDPRFRDFNGDGFLDLMVLELDDPEALYQGFMDNATGTFYRGAGAPELPNNLARSRVYLQVPNAAPGEDRWVRAPRFDLPAVPFQTVGSGGFAPTGSVAYHPFAHSQPMSLDPLHVRANYCPGFLGIPNWEYCAPLSFNTNLGIRLADLNRDGLTDLVWSRQHQFTDVEQYPEFPVIAEGVLLNTGTGWCSSVPEMAVHVESACPDAAIYYPPKNSWPTLPGVPNGFAFWDHPDSGMQTGQLADLNADGYLDYIQTHTNPNRPGREAWIFDPAGASRPVPDMWIKDPRYDLDIDYDLIGDLYLETIGLAVVDIDGDGAADIVGDSLKGPASDPTPVPQAFVSKSTHSDLLKLVRNGTGGQLAIRYASAILQRDGTAGGLEEEAEADAQALGEALGATALADSVRWDSGPVVREIRIAGPNRAPDPDLPGTAFGPPTTYRYGHPRFCTKSRSELGFRIVEETRPGGEVVTRHFHQLHGRAGRTSSVVVSEDGIDVHRYEEDWEIRPAVPADLPGSIADPEVHVGRLVETRSMNLYPDGGRGALLRRRFEYDDAYGYNFVERTVETRPTGTLATLRVPDSDPAASIFGLVAEEKRFGRETAAFGDLDFLEHTLTSHFLGRPAMVTRRTKARDAGGPGASQSESFEYDAWGNLTRHVVHGSEGDRITDYCFDGDAQGGDDADWCPDLAQTAVVQDSHSVRVGIRDALGGIVEEIPDPVFATIVETHSSYSDEPSSRVELDPFGRPTQTWVAGDGSDWIRTSRTVYDDSSFETPVLDRFLYPEADSADDDAIWSSIVSDGFGGTWKEIGETPSGFVARLTYHDPANRTLRQSLPTSCADETCSGRTGAVEAFASLVRTDAIGRPLRSDTPDGVSVFAYSWRVKRQGPGALGGIFDSVLEKNGKGDLVRRAFDGERIGWIEECGHSLDPETVDIRSAGCTGSGSTVTHYEYEATGELSMIHDPRSAPPFDDPGHVLRYHYDTRGRVVRIEDPDLSGSGETRTSYDDYGRVASTTNARRQQRSFVHDPLGRLTRISTPTGETDYTLVYRPGEKRAGIDSSDDYQRTISFDGLGRVARERMAVRNASGLLQEFHTDYSYDLLGRITRILHPAKHYSVFGWEDTAVRYEYVRGFLDQVCEPGSASDCDSAEKRYVSAVGFDDLGQPISISHPGGVRSFEYDPATLRLVRDGFSSATYQYSKSYDERDGLGNILSTSGFETATPALDMNDSYSYDRRNRVERWSKEGIEYTFAYDDLGNLTRHADEGQVYSDPARPHAITRRDLPSPIDYGYDDDGNVVSILGGAQPQYFGFDSANRLVCQGRSPSSCDTRIAYDVNGKRIAEYAGSSGLFSAHIGDTFLYENDRVSSMASVEILLGGKRIALKRFRPKLRPSSASLFAFRVPRNLLAGGAGGLVFLLIVCCARGGVFLAIRLRPLRASMALTAAGSLFIPSIATAGVPSNASLPDYYWEISDPLGSSSVMLDEEGGRLRHQTFTPFGRVHGETGIGLRTWFAGHRRDDRSGLIYMKSRWYDPASGRFLSIDPLVRSAFHPQSTNGYSYVENNPVNQTDSSGMSLDWPGPSGRPFIFQMHGLGWVDSTTITLKITNKKTGATITRSKTTHSGSIAGGTAGLGQGAIDAIGRRSGSGGGSLSGSGDPIDPFAGAEKFPPVIGKRSASHGPAELDRLFNAPGVEQFPTVTPQSYANFVAHANAGNRSPSPASPMDPTPPPNMGLGTGPRAKGLADALRSLVAAPGPGNPTVLAIMGAGALISGAGALLTALAVGLGFGTVIGVSAAGLAILGVGLLAIGTAELVLARRARGS